MICALVVAFVVVSSAASAVAQSPLEIAFEAPESVILGDPIPLAVTIRNVSAERVTVRDPVLDARSFDFGVRFGQERESRYTAFHPGAGQGSNLRGQHLEAGATLSFTHEVVALKAGKWRWKPFATK